jgi:hypothetical protein
VYGKRWERKRWEEYLYGDSTSPYAPHITFEWHRANFSQSSAWDTCMPDSSLFWVGYSGLLTLTHVTQVHVGRSACRHMSIQAEELVKRAAFDCDYLAAALYTGEPMQA